MTRLVRYPPVTACALVLCLAAGPSGAGIDPAGSPAGPEAKVLSTFDVEIDSGGDEALRGREAEVRDLVRASLLRVQRVRPVTDARIVIGAGSKVIPEIGAAGWLVGPSLIKVTVDTARENWLQSLQETLPFLLAHELSHMIRERHFIARFDPTAPIPEGEEEKLSAAFKSWMMGRPPTLGDFVIHEGYADHFAMEVTGGAPRVWDLGLGAEDLAKWTRYVAEHWEEMNYDRMAWVNGSDEIPRFAAYAVGFSLVARHLESHPGARASDLIVEPSRVFDPGGERHDDAAGSDPTAARVGE